MLINNCFNVLLDLFIWSTRIIIKVLFYTTFFWRWKFEDKLNNNLYKSKIEEVKIFQILPRELIVSLTDALDLAKPIGYKYQLKKEEEKSFFSEIKFFRYDNPF